jgi:hypothetical protein
METFKFDGYTIGLDFLERRGWLIFREVATSPFDESFLQFLRKDMTEQYLHSDGVWRISTAVGNVFSGYFLTKEEALETLHNTKKGAVNLPLEAFSDPATIELMKALSAQSKK